MDLHQTAIWSGEVRVKSETMGLFSWGMVNKKTYANDESPVCHGPVKEAVHGVYVHVQVLGRLHDEVDIPLAGLQVPQSSH